MNTGILRWLILCQLNGLALSYCLFGDGSDCAFQCHCAVESECDEGQCPSGCETAPLGYNWAGPACQIGNVGLHKSADMTAEGDFVSRYPASAALDGDSPGRISSNCAHPANTGNNPAEWWADLGDVYKIYNITIYGRTDCCDWRLQDFDLTVYNASDNEVLCAQRNDSIKTNATMTCTRPLIGRYVHFKRTGGTEIEQTALCEVVIIGHKYIDCTLCPDGVACNDVTGCEQCRATYQPDCKQACEDGFYQTNCKQRCGRCKDGDKACDKVDGRCPNGCEIWWTDTTCNTYIDLPNHNNESVTVTHKTTDSIQIQWQHIRGISADLRDFYGYLIQYKDDAVCDNYTEAGIVKYDSTASWKIDKLKPGREYWIEIKPFREYEGKKEFGTPYSALKVKTDCGEKAEDESSSSWNKAIIVGASGGVLALVIVIVIVLVIILVLRRQRKTNSGSDEHDNIAFQPEDVNTEIRNIKNGGRVFNVSGTSMTSQVINGHDGAVASVSVPEDKMYETSADNLEESKPEVAAADLTVAAKRPAADQGVYVTSAILVDNFESYVARKMAKIEELYEEFRTLPQPDFNRCNVATTPDNKPKNRYRTIYAYDDTRVILNDGEKGDYINANFITGYNKNKEYIATQGTKKTTWIDFWRMVWQEKCNCIVMVANTKEMGKDKIDPYWPENIGDTLKVGAFIVTTQALNITADYTIRIMTVSKGRERRTLRQFHFTTWKDKDRPMYGIHTLQAFIDKVHAFHHFSEAPLIVHCSAGIGRTGTFIALDILEHAAMKEKAIDVYGCVQRLRQQRMLMVQTKAQYVLLHEALADFIKYGNKAIDCMEFQQTFATICDRTPKKAIMTQIGEEFELLKGLKIADGEQMKEGLKAENISKNRNDAVVPGNRDRLFLSRGKSGDYINAVSVDSFKAHDSYVVTQMPLPHTVADFWQLVVEQACQAIVMLNDMDSSDKSCLPYWPEEVKTKQQYGRVEVELISVKTEDSIVIRDLKVQEVAAKSFIKPQILTIRHFQLLSWPAENELPPKRYDVLKLMEMLQNWQQHNQIPASKWKPLIHCLDGVSRSGMFCGTSFLLDRMKIEQDVNAFMSVRYVSTHRPQFFSELHEYQLLYQMALEYINQHNDYSNFH